MTLMWKKFKMSFINVYEEVQNFIQSFVYEDFWSKIRICSLRPL